MNRAGMSSEGSSEYCGANLASRRPSEGSSESPPSMTSFEFYSPAPTATRMYSEGSSESPDSLTSSEFNMASRTPSEGSSDPMTSSEIYSPAFTSSEFPTATRMSSESPGQNLNLEPSEGSPESLSSSEFNYMSSEGSSECSPEPPWGYTSWASESLTSSRHASESHPLKFTMTSTPLTSGLTSSPASSESHASFTSTSSPMSSESPPIRQKCAICPRPAYCINYGVISCDACKMFFRRIVVLKRDYKCKGKHNCVPAQKCKACRYQQCLDAGMSFFPSFLELKNARDDGIVELISRLMFLDARRCEKMRSCWTEEDLELMEVLEKRGMRLEERKSNLTTHDWSFLGIYTSIEFLCNFEFMDLLDLTDKITLIKNFSVKASLFSSAMRAVREKRDRLMTVDGKDVYPDGLTKLDKFTDSFLNRIRSLLVSRLHDLRITNEESVLISAIFFCDPALITLSIPAQSLLSAYQKTYSSALLQYCMHTYQQCGPSRFTDLLGLCHVINRNFEDVQYMTMIFRFYQRDVKYRKIVSEVI